MRIIIRMEPGYTFSRVNHAAILTHSVLVGLTPLIPIPFVDDWVKSGFQRRMLRQISAARGVNLTPVEVEALLQEDFWDSCAEGCLSLVGYVLRELLSKIFIFLEWRRAINLVSLTYYTGFLFDAALLDGYAFDGSKENAARLREAIRRARYGANLRLIQRLVRPGAMVSAAWQVLRRALGALPGMLAALPGAIWRGVRSAPGRVARGVLGFPGRVRANFYLRVQVLLGREKAPEIRAVENLVRSMQEALLKMDPAHFDALHAKLVEEINRGRR